MGTRHHLQLKLCLGDSSTGTYMMYFCTSSTAKRPCIAYGVSKSSTGPFSYVDTTLVYSGFTKASTTVTTISTLEAKTVIAEGEMIDVDRNLVTALKEIPAGHKVCIKDLAENESVVKYGFQNVLTKQAVKKGSWIHTHNIIQALEIY